MYVPIFLFRRYTYAGILCILQPYPAFQIVICAIQSLMVRIIIIIY